MAFFKFRKRGDEPSAAAVQPESVEVMRRRAKHRLIGAAVLVLAGVIGLPLLFDKQPRPIAVDTPIEIPDKNKVKPLNIPAPAMIDARKSEAAAVVSPVPVAPVTSVTPVIPVEPAVPAAPKAPEVIAVPQSAPVPAPVERVAKEAVKAVVKADEGVKAKALLEGRAPESPAQADNGRYVVQVGAFADPKRAREVRLKVERSGLKTYTQVAETKDGSRIRVRVGPFDSKGEADKAAEKIKRLDLPVAILTL